MKDLPAPRHSQARGGPLQGGRSSESLRSARDPGAWPENPVLIEVWRSGFLESVHRGALVVLGADGQVHTAVGDVTRPVLPRSANKPLQAVASLTAGWAPRSAEETALGAASHNGEDGHRELVAAMLAAVGLAPDALGCPPDLPKHEATRARWLADGREPERIAMNCSGKHAAMLSACVASGWDTEGYLDPEHPLQRAIEVSLATLTGEPVGAVVVDGCGAPQHALSLTALARGVLSLVRAGDGSRERAVVDGMRAAPWHVAGTDREDTDLMRAVPGLVTKVGADGVHVAALPQGAVAVKLDDGGERGRTTALCAGLRRLGVPADLLAPWLLTPVRGGGGVVGEVRPSGALAP